MIRLEKIQERRPEGEEETESSAGKEVEASSREGETDQPLSISFTSLKLLNCIKRKTETIWVQ